MKYTKLNNGLNMPLLGMGSIILEDENHAVDLIIGAFEKGYRSIDTAEAYKNEHVIGRAIKESGIPRSEFFITSKVWTETLRTGDIKVAFQKSLERLGIDYIDLYLIHWPVPDKFVSAWQTLTEIYTTGETRAIGVSNFKEHHLKAIKEVSDVIPAVNQYEHHPYLTQKSILEYCNKEDIVVEAYCPLGRAKNGVLNDSIITSLAKKYEKTSAQVILRWHVELGIIAIPSSSNAKRIAENIDIFDFELTEEEVKSIDALNRDERVVVDPDNFTH